MKANVKLIQKQRSYSEEFKRSIVKDFESGKFSVLQLERLHKIKAQIIYRWIYKYSQINERGQRIVEMKDSSTKKLKALEQRVKELEQTVGKKQIQIDYLEKMIDVAKDELDIDIKKNSNTPQSNGFAKTKKKISFSMNQLYKTIGISKQAVHQYAKRQDVFNQKIANLVIEADDLREAHPGCGVEKMYDTLRPDFIGRDRFVETFMELGYRLKRKKNYTRTTYSAKVYYPNLIKGMIVSKPSVIWQSDITYIHAGDRFYYAVFIIDVYTKKIVGYTVSDHMRAAANIKALKMALKDNQAPEIHHSDRGSQYIYNGYVALLNANNCKISMAKTAQDNAYAERINRTIKNDYLEYWKPKSFTQLKRMVKKAVNHYNTERPHNNIGKVSPVEFEKRLLMKSTFHQQSITIFNNEINV